MAKSFEQHEWQIEIECGSARLKAKDECRGPYHEETCARSRAEAEWRREHIHIATGNESIETDMGVVNLASGDSVMFGEEPEWPDCTCEEPPGEPCICWEYAGDLGEMIGATLDVKADYHYSYDAYHKEVDCWIEIKEATLAGV